MEATGTINRPIEILLRICGLWPGSSYTLFCRSYWLISFVTALTFQYRYIMKYLHSIDLSELMDEISIILVSSLLSFKLIIFWFNQRTLNKILAMIVTDWKEDMRINFSARAMANKAILSQQFSNFILGFYAMSIVLYCSAVFIVDFIDSETSNGFTRPFLMKMDLPFDGNRRVVYEFVILVQFYYMMICACATAILNALLIALILHIGGQIDILCGWLMNIFQGEKYGLKVATVRKVIKKHQKIINFSENIENLYSYVTMVQFFSDTLIICSLGFILITSIGTPDAWVIITRTFLFYFVMNLEAFTFCFAGEYLSTKSKTIGDAAYNSLWYELNSKDSRIILFLIMRSQNVLTLRMGKVMNLSLAQFSDIIKASASYISVLLAMH